MVNLESLSTLVDLTSPVAETLFGSFADIFPQLTLIQHADEITKSRYNLEDKNQRKKLRKARLWTADFALYKIEKDKPFLYLARRENNLIFQNPETALEELFEKGYYQPKKKEAQNVIQARSTLKIDLSQLNLIKFERSGYFEIDVPSYGSQLNSEQKKLVERIFGCMEKKPGENSSAFEKAMKLLREGNIQKTEVFLLHPNYLQKYIKKGNSLAFLCRLDDFGHNSIFFALEHETSGYQLYGFRPEELEYVRFFNHVLSQPHRLNKERASKLLSLLRCFYKRPSALEEERVLKFFNSLNHSSPEKNQE